MCKLEAKKNLDYLKSKDPIDYKYNAFFTVIRFAFLDKIPVMDDSIRQAVIKYLSVIKNTTQKYKLL